MAFVKKNRKENRAPAVADPIAPTLPPVSNSHVPSAVDHGQPPNGSVPPHAPLLPPKALDNSESGKRLGEQLIGSRLITEEQLDAALAFQATSGGRLGEVLVRMGVLTEQALAHALAAFFGFDVANLRRDNVDPATLMLVPENVAREYMAVPIRMNA